MKQIEAITLAEMICKLETGKEFYFYGDFDEERYETSEAYGVACVEIFDAKMAVINYYGGGEALAIDLNDILYNNEAELLESIEEGLKDYFDVRGIDSVWIDETEPSNRGVVEIANTANFTYYSNCCGDIFDPTKGIHVVSDGSNLPPDVLKWYNEVFNEGTGSLMHLATVDNEWFILLINEFDKEFLSDVLKVSVDTLTEESMNDFYCRIKQHVEVLREDPYLRKFGVMIGKNTGDENCHEVITLCPLGTTKNAIALAAKSLYDKVYKIPFPPNLKGEPNEVTKT